MYHFRQEEWIVGSRPSCLPSYDHAHCVHERPMYSYIYGPHPCGKNYFVNRF